MIINVLWGLAILIVLSLAFYAGYLLLKVRRQQDMQGLKLAELESFLGQEKARRVLSIRLLARGVLDQQLSLTEAAIRITALLDILGQGQSARSEHAALYKLADETLHIPRLKDWQALSRPEKKRLEKDRLSSEAKYKDFIFSSAKELAQFEFNDAVK